MCIHGILGTPEHFAPFLPLAPDGWTVCNLRLKGHGGSARDFSAASMAAWKQQVGEALQALRENHDQVIIAAHSMGTLFAIQEAVKTPVEALFLLNVPLKLRIRPRLFRMTWRVFRGRIPPDDVWALAAQKAYGIQRDPHLWRYLGWIPRYLELFAEIRKTRKLVQKLQVPSQVYLSKEDEMVSPKGGRLFWGNGHIVVKALGASGHYYYAPEDLRLLREDFCDMVKEISSVLF